MDKKYILEIGCGNGEFLEQYYYKNSQRENLYLIGIEIAKKFYLKAVKRTEKFRRNSEIYLGDARKEIKNFKNQNIKFSEIHINFPDPWFKLKHHKRILCTSSFLAALSEILENNGFISIVTDVWELCFRIINYGQRVKSLKNIYLPEGFKLNLEFPKTNFYQKAIANNSDIFFIKFNKNESLL
ncbi:MAG TPA: hypothetical protein PLD27_03600 [bacterium]|nr:hypothetical protein [bacterium]HOL48584.1 hypothetical protein [bacterium]HPQ17887.1 hypothetical protein [bacterium]